MWRARINEGTQHNFQDTEDREGRSGPIKASAKAWAAICYTWVFAGNVESHAAALLLLDIPNYEGQNGKLLFCIVTIVQLSDVLQYVWGKTLGRHKIAPAVSPNKTWEGFLGGVVTTTAIGSYAFQNCTGLRTAHFQGNAPTADATAFSGTINLKVYRLRGTLDWSSTFGGSPTELWALPNPVILTLMTRTSRHLKPNSSSPRS